MDRAGGAFLEGLQLLEGGGFGAEDLVAFDKEAFAFPGQLKVPTSSLKELGANGCFELSEHAAGGWLGNAKEFGGPGDVLKFGDCLKNS